MAFFAYCDSEVSAACSLGSAVSCMMDTRLKSLTGHDVVGTDGRICSRRMLSWVFGLVAGMQRCVISAPRSAWFAVLFQ